MRASTSVIAGLVALLAACGGDEPAARIHVGFRVHALECQIEGKLEAKIQISGLEDPCTLDVSEDRTVSGFCAAVPTGMERTFRLVYFIMIGETEVQLAYVTQTIDLTGETRRTITLEFSSDEVITDFDDDGDHVSNIVEVCSGRNPLLMDS